MFLEEEVYSMLNWGFGTVMVIQWIFLVALWFNYKFDFRSFIYFLLYLFTFSFAGINLLVAINTVEYEFMGSENASFSIAIAGISWILSILLLLSGITRLVRFKNNG